MQETLPQALAELAAASEREYLNDGTDRGREAILLRAELYNVADLE
jgi:hypothetical protein